MNISGGAAKSNSLTPGARSVVNLPNFASGFAVLVSNLATIGARLRYCKNRCDLRESDPVLKHVTRGYTYV
jgi:hypothetical protein